MSKFRWAFEAFLVAVVAMAAWLTLTSDRNVVDMTAPVRVLRGEADLPVVSGDYNKFIYKFFKLRSDCHTPSIKRVLVNMATGSTVETHDRRSSVVQFPKTSGADPDKIEVETWIPKGTPAQEHSILSEICYNCPGAKEPICRPFSSEPFIPQE